MNPQFIRVNVLARALASALCKKPFLAAFLFWLCSAGFAVAQQPVTKQAVSAAKDSLTYTIYLSFDDGPLQGSEDINEAVKKEDIKVSVFVVGMHAQSSRLMAGYYKLYELNPYIEIGNHSYTHAHDHYKAYYAKPDSVLADFEKNRLELNIHNKLARLPGRNMWRLKDLSINDVKEGREAADDLFRHGYRVFGWDLEWQHSGESGIPIQTVNEMVENIERKLKEGKTVRKNHLVLLSHDEMFRNGWEESELKELVIKLKQKGNFRFDHLSNYPD